MAKLTFIPNMSNSTEFYIYVEEMRSGVGKRIMVFLNGSGIEDVTRSESVTEELFVASNLNPNTTYGVVVLIFYDDGDTLNLTGEYTTPAGSTSSAELSLTNITSTSFDVEISGMYHQSVKIIVIYLNGNRFYIDPSYRGESETSATISLTGLTSDTLYEVKAHVIYTEASGHEEEILMSSCRTLSGGGSSPIEWNVEYKNAYSDVNETLSLDYNLLAGEVARIRVTFVNSGTATFYSTGSCDPIAFLSDSSSFDGSTGEPSSCLKEKDQGGAGNNFSFTYEVEEDINYYLFVRHYYIDDSGNVAVHIVPPNGSPPIEPDDEWGLYDCMKYDNLSSVQELDTSIEAGVVSRVTFTCTNSGNITIYSESDMDVIGFISKTSSFDSANGEPDGNYETDDDSGAGYNFSITYNVIAEETYYLWVRGVNETVSGDITIYINPPSGSSTTRPSYFAWDAPKVSGAAFNITASEWRNLLDNINEVCVYRGLSSVNSTSNQSVIDSFYYPSKGDEFKAAMYNQCIYQFARLGLIRYSDHSVESGDTITAVRINFLRDTINDVE